MNRLCVGIMPQERIRARTISIAKGDYTPDASEPKIWISSIEDANSLLSDRNRRLLHVITEQNPISINQLSVAAGLNRSEVSRALVLMSRYNLVEIIRNGRCKQPVAKATEFLIKIPL